ncbi:MAG TPA: hypothetical protein VLH79_06905 [Chthonomonadales bacterium]|nr:hypothetical protein [Chthonomonadales bacterium]
MHYLKHPFRAPRASSPVAVANAFERSGGFAVFALPGIVLRALHLAWLPFAIVLGIGLALATPAGLGLAAIVGSVSAGVSSAGLAGGLIAFVAASALCAPLAYRHGDGRVHAPTLTVQQLLLDVIGAFQKRFPAINMFGAQWTAQSLKLNKKHTAHIAVYGSASTYDTTTGYANGANTARNGLVDVDVITDVQPTYPLKWLHLDGIKDDKNQYAKVMAGGGYTLGKSCIDNGFFAKMTTRYFSQETVTAVADCDYDWLQTLTTALNGKGVEPEGRVLFVNSSVAAVLAVDPRMISKDFAGQLLTGQGYRMWQNVGGFALIQEYPDLPSNNGSALTSVSAEADDDLITKAAHGLETGDPFVISAMTNGTGLSINTRYWAIKASSSTFKAATSYANAIAGTAIDITVDGTSMTVTKTENLIAFAADGRAFASLAGVPQGMQEMAAQLGIVQTLMFDVVTDPNSKITMAAAKWQEPATGDVYWCPTFIYGTNAGKQGSTAVAGNTAAANSILAAANVAGTAMDYAGLRISSGAS